MNIIYTVDIIGIDRYNRDIDRQPYNKIDNRDRQYNTLRYRYDRHEI